MARNLSYRLTAVGAAALMSLTAAACSSSSDATAPTTGPSTTVATSTTTAPPTTAAPAPPVGRPTSEEAARTLYDAWIKNDRATALTVAEQVAVDEIWKAAHGPYEFYSACDDGEFGTGGCLYRDRSTGHTIQLNTERVGSNWVITSAFYSAE